MTRLRAAVPAVIIPPIVTAPSSPEHYTPPAPAVPSPHRHPRTTVTTQPEHEHHDYTACTTHKAFCTPSGPLTHARYDITHTTHHRPTFTLSTDTPTGVVTTPALYCLSPIGRSKMRDVWPIEDGMQAWKA